MSDVDGHFLTPQKQHKKLAELGVKIQVRDQEKISKQQQ